MRELIRDYLKMLELGPVTTHQNMGVFPVFAETAASSQYLSLDEALENRFIEITEVSEAGDVPNLKVKNQAEIAILILAGEELVGAKQNRIVNASFLIGGGRIVDIPVSCVEQGRWRYCSKEFSSVKRMGSPILRKGVHEDVLHSIGAGMGFRADQGRVWEEVAAKSARMSVRSETGAMSDIYESYEEQLRAYTEKFSQAENQKGILVSINDEIIGLEIFDSSDSLRKYFEKMIYSYALDAIDLASQRHSGWHHRPDAKMWLEELSELPLMMQPSLDLGQDVRIESNRVIGSGLLKEGQLLYLSVFAKDDEQGRVGTRMARSSRRGSMAR